MVQCVGNRKTGFDTKKCQASTERNVFLVLFKSLYICLCHLCLCVCILCFCFILHSCCIIVSMVGWT